MANIVHTKAGIGKYILFVDWETSGADFKTGDHTKYYQGLSYGVVIADSETFEPVETLYRELQFDDTKYQWSDEAEAIHGLSREYLKEHGVTREEGLIDLLELILKYIGSGKICIGGHNVTFDRKFCDQLAEDFEMTMDFHHVVIETSALAFVAVGLYRSNEVFPFFGAEVRGKHNALDDALQSLAVARGIKQLVQTALEG